MPAEKTHSDSLREYLTGAASDGGVQTDPNASLGNYRSATEVLSMSIAVANAIPNITVAYASGGNTEGAGTLNATDANTLQWKCAGDTYGVSIPILNGQTMLLESGTGPGAFIRVTRTSATALTGTATVTLAKAINNVFALDDVTSAEALAGETEYRGTIIVNASSGPVSLFLRWIGVLGTQQVSDAGQLGGAGAGTITTTGSFASFPDNGWVNIKNAGVTREIVYYSSRTNTVLTVPATGRARLGSTAAAGANTDTIDAVPGIALAIDTAGVTAGAAAIQTIANQNTAPAAVSWNTGITSATGLNIGSMAAGQQVGVWVKREIPVAAASTASAAVVVQDSFSAT